MSAALAAAATATSSEPARRRLSALRLVRLVMAAPRFADALMVGSVPYGAEIVLRAIATGIADASNAGGELGVFRPPEGPFPLAAVLGARMGPGRTGLLGAEARIDGDLVALLEAGMVIRREDGALTLPLDFDRLSSPTPPAQALEAGQLAHLPPKHRAAIQNGGKGGRPPGSGKTGAPEGQRNLRLFTTLAASPDGRVGYSGSSAIGSVAETHGETHWVSGAEPGGQTQGYDRVSVVGFSARTEVESQVAVAGSPMALNSIDGEAAAAALSGARGRGNPRTENPETHDHKTQATETHGRETQGGAGFSGNPGQNPPPIVTEAAIALAAEGVSLFGWRGSSARAAPAIIQRQLDAGYRADEIGETMRQHAGREINGARFFDRVLASGRGETSVLAPPGVAAARPAANGAVELLARAREMGRPLPDLPR